MSDAQLGRRLFLMRHGERVDRVFTSKDGVPWVDKCFMPDCIYKRLDTNMPRHCPLRGRDGGMYYDVADYNFDPPLTAIGEGTAEQLGFHASYSQWKFTVAYSSPSLRCLQTVTRFLKGMKDGGANVDHLLPLKIEPGVFDFCGFNEYQFSGIPTFLNAKWMDARGIRMSTNYVPSMPADKLDIGENVTTFYARADKAIKHILKLNSKTPGSPPASILVATHAPFVDTVVQVLLKQPARNDERMKNVANYLKYIGTLTLEEDPKEENKWRMIPPPVRTFRYASNPKFEWKKMVTGEEERERD